MDISKLKRPGSFDAKTFKQDLRGAIRHGFSHLKDNEPDLSEIVKKNQRAIKFGKFGSQKQKQAWQDLQKQADKSGVDITSPDRSVIKKIFKVLGDKPTLINKDGGPQARFKPEVMRRIERGERSNPYRDRVKNEGRLTRADITNRADQISGNSHSDHPGVAGSGANLRTPGDGSGVQKIKPGESLGSHQAGTLPGNVGGSGLAKPSQGPRPLSRDFLSR